MISRVCVALLASTMLMTTACADDQKPEETAVTVAAATAPAVSLPPSSDADWRDVDPENTLYITTKYGVFVIELAPELAPKHVAQIKKLTRQKFYDNITFHRVMEGFMNQTGDPRGDGTGDSAEPDIQAEFTFRRSPDMDLMVTGKALSKMGEVETGFYKAFPIATKPIGNAFMMKDGRVDAFGLHCPGTTSMARGGHDVNSGNSQFFLMRADYPSLDTQYSIWGRTVWGNEHLTKIKVGTKGETPNFVPDEMLTVRVAADVAPKDRIGVQVMKTDSAAFAAYVDTLRTSSGVAPAICDIDVPSRVK